jgi:hypothetical protein
MKKQIITKVLFASFILAMSGFVLNLQAQDIVVEFTNPDDKDYGSSNDGFLGVGLGGSGSGATAEGLEYAVDDPHVDFIFTIGATGQIALDVFTPTTYPAIVDVLNTWDNPAIGLTTNDALFGKSFTLRLTAESRMQLGYDATDGNSGGIGIRGKNQRRIDDEGENNEWMQFELLGDAGIDYVRIGYNDVAGDADAHMLVIDHDTRGYEPILDGDEYDGPTHSPDQYIDATDYNMRYFSDILRFSTEDTIDVGYRLYSLEFDVVAAQPKPPAVVSTTPADKDSTTNTVADDYVIQWDASMDQAATEAAVSITPAVTNRADTWSTGAAGDIQTISFDDLEFETWYTVVVSTAALGTNGLNKLEADTFMFKTLPEPPSVVNTFPANLATDVPIDSPISIEFSKAMVADSVEKAISFNPALVIESYVWSEDMKTVYLMTAEMVPSNMYFGTVDVVATDEFGTQMSEPYVWAFTTSLATSAVANKVDDVVFYPNPVSDILTIQGMDVATVRIYSLTGKLIKEVYNSTVVSVGDLQTGVYAVLVSDREDNQVRKMIVVE